MARFLPTVVTDRLRGLVERLPNEASQAVALRVIGQAERVLGQLEATARVLDKVARAELSLLEKLEPIVDDLGRLVRLQLEDARRRMTGGEPPAIIDVEPRGRAGEVQGPARSDRDGGSSEQS